MRDVLLHVLGKGGPLGGVRFDLTDDRFDNQPALALLPKSIVTPFEIIASICTSSLSESNKDNIVAMLADICAERLEHFISQVTKVLSKFISSDTLLNRT